MIKEIIQEVFEKRKSFQKNSIECLQIELTTEPLFLLGIPTLKEGIYREFTPMLKCRFEIFGRWLKATHGDWLSISDMKELWNEAINDDLLAGIKFQRICGEENWPNEVSALFKPERLSLFAGSDLGNEKIYLVWFDFVDEPELWVYDSNGESRYKNLQDYLLAYLSDDLSASERGWKL